MEAVELIVAVLESGIIEDVVSDVMAVPEVFAAIDSGEGIKSSISNHLASWTNTAKNKLLSEPIQQSLIQEIELFNEAKLYSEEAFFEHIDDLLHRLDINSPFREQGFALIAQEDKNSLFIDHFFIQWQEALFTCLQEAKLESLKQDREQLLEDLYQRQDTINKLTEVHSDIRESSSMRLWDMAKAKLNKGDIKSLKKTANILNKNGELQEIARQLGRMAGQNSDQDLNRTKVQKKRKKETKAYSSGNIVGIKQSDELARLLPIELMFLSSPDLDVLFYKNLIEKRLTTYQQQNKQTEYENITTYEQQPKKAEEETGPFIVAIDASGSMMGSAENCAKAFTYGLIQVALAEKRDCYVILFSGQQVTYELTHSEGLTEILNFLSYTFHGGTDLVSVLENSFNLMNTEKYKNSDLIVLSDFMVPSITTKTIDKLNALKENSNRFHALSLSKYRNEKVLALFDQHWAYNPSKLASFKRLFGR